MDSFKSFFTSLEALESTFTWEKQKKTKGILENTLEFFVPVKHQIHPAPVTGIFYYSY